MTLGDSSMKRKDGLPRKGKLILCEKCAQSISSFAFKKHNEKCDGIGPFDRTYHIRTLEQRRTWTLIGGHGTGKRRAWNKGLTKETDKRVLAYIEKRRPCSPRGPALKKWWEEHPEAKIAHAKNGGYKERSGRSKGAYVVDSFGKKTWLQSSYEVLCSQLLLKQSIRWIRPTFMFYIINGEKKRYFPDFFLVDFNIYLDPKNDYLAKIEKTKIEEISKQCNVKIEILTQDKLNTEYILSLLH